MLTIYGLRHRAMASESSVIHQLAPKYLNMEADAVAHEMEEHSYI